MKLTSVEHKGKPRPRSSRVARAGPGAVSAGCEQWGSTAENLKPTMKSTRSWFAFYFYSQLGSDSEPQ